MIPHHQLPKVHVVDIINVPQYPALYFQVREGAGSRPLEIKCGQVTGFGQSSVSKGNCIASWPEHLIAGASLPCPCPWLHELWKQCWDGSVIKRWLLLQLGP